MVLCATNSRTVISYKCKQLLLHLLVTHKFCLFSFVIYKEILKAQMKNNKAENGYKTSVSVKLHFSWIIVMNVT